MFRRNMCSFCMMILAGIITIVSFSGLSAAQLDCITQVGSPCPVTHPADVFHMSANDDAHASNDGSYNVRVCCNDPTIAVEGGPGVCSGMARFMDWDIVLRLSGPTDAHVEKNTQATPAYDGNDVCIRADGANQVICSYAMDCSTLGADYECVAKLSGDTDAHVSDCAQVNGYESICCRVVTSATPVSGRLIFGSESYYLSLGENRLIPFTARNIEAAPDNMTIRLHGYDTATFDYSCGSGCYISSSDERRMNIYDINPDEGRTYFFRLVPSSPGTEQLEFNVTIDSDPNMYEIYTIDITTGYPVFFPGLGTWGIAFMILAAGLVFMFYGKMPGKKG